MALERQVSKIRTYQLHGLMRTAGRGPGKKFFFFEIFVFMGGIDAAKTFTTLSSDTKNDVPAKGVEDTSSKTKRKGSSGDARAGCWERTAVRDGQKPGMFEKRREMAWKWMCSWIG